MQKLGKKSTKDAKTNLALELGDSADFIISTRKKKKLTQLDERRTVAVLVHR